MLKSFFGVLMICVVLMLSMDIYGEAPRQRSTYAVARVGEEITKIDGKEYIMVVVHYDILHELRISNTYVTCFLVNGKRLENHETVRIVKPSELPPGGKNSAGLYFLWLEKTNENISWEFLYGGMRGFPDDKEAYQILLKSYEPLVVSTNTIPTISKNLKNRKEFVAKLAELAKTQGSPATQPATQATSTNPMK